MAKGIAAFVIVLTPVLAISILSGVGYYDALDVSYGDTAADQDVQNAANALQNAQASDTGGSAIVEFTTGAATALQSAWTVIGNTSGVLKLLFNVPNVLAGQLQLFFQIIFGLTFIGFIRGVVF